jgi:hypothetical protein
VVGTSLLCPVRSIGGEVHQLGDSRPAGEGSKVADKLDDVIPNLDYDSCVAKDQHVLNYMMSSMSREILSHVATMPTVAAVLEEIEAIFAS